MSRRPIALFVAALTLGLAPRPAAAGASEDCPTFFPDFRCERSGRYEGFVMPMAMPYLFEDPFITTNISVHGIAHDFPDDSILDGGYAGVIAIQARVAITDRLAFIATKDGYTWLRPGHRLPRDQQGFMDITAGLKYALIDMPERNFILTPSIRFEAPTGSSDIFSGNGDGVAIPAIAAAWGIGGFHVIADIGGRIPFDGDDETTSIFYNLHFDYALHRLFVPFLEISGTHYTSSGDGRLIVHTRIGDLRLNTVQGALGSGRADGNDVLNLGSRGVAGNDIVTMAVGARIPLMEHVSLGLSYEFPVTSREDLFQQRYTTNLTFEF